MICCRRVRRALPIALAAAVAVAAPGCQRPRGAVPPRGPLVDEYGEAADRIVAAALASDRAWARLEHLTDRIGARLSGSPELERAIAWAADEMRADGLEVRTEPVLVPHWVRGEEHVEVVAPTTRRLSALGLGNTVGTPPEGVTGEVVIVRTFEELSAPGDGARGKIAFFAHAMPPWSESGGSGYGQASRFRVRGPAAASRAGAVAALTRSATARSLRTPHTGVTIYGDAPPIPAAALALEDAAYVERLARSGPVTITIRLGARTLPDAESANVVADLRGRERPDEIVLIGAHIDSWDVGQGAHDDGAGVVAVMEAAALLARLDLRPRRTIRVVLFTNEENGVRGARAYAEAHRDELGRHVAALEMDSGGFAPLGFGTGNMGPRSRSRVADVATLLWRIGATRVTDGGTGADIEVALGDAGVPLLGLTVDGRTYFDIHHTEADTLDKVDPEDLRRDVAAIAVMAYVLAEMPDRLGQD